MTTPRVSDPKDQAPRPPEAANSDREVGTRGRQDDYEIKGWLGDQICGDGSSELPVGGVREIWGWTRVVQRDLTQKEKLWKRDLSCRKLAQSCDYSLVRNWEKKLSTRIGTTQ